VGVGWSPHPRLRLGAALFVAYESLSGASLAQATRGAGPAPEEFSNTSELFSYKRAGVELSFGAQWHPLDGLRIGLTVRPPGFNVYAAETTDRASSFATRDGAALRSGAAGASTDTSSFEFTQRTPLRVRVGVAWERPRFTVSLDGDIAAPFTPDDPDDRAWSLHWNLRLGGVWRITERLRAGAGVFTDRDPGRSATQRPVDFYGGTVGVEWGTLHILRDAQRDRLTFSTSLSARYAYGQGAVDAVAVDANATSATSTTSTLDVHEVAVYLGSSFRF